MKVIVEKEIKEITDAKFDLPKQEDMEKAQNIVSSLRNSQGSDGSRTPKVPNQGGAPPSADNNV